MNKMFDEHENTNGSGDSRREATLLSSLGDRLQLISKIQLPKINNDLAYLKTLCDKILKQNEEILNKFAETKKDSKCKGASLRKREIMIVSPRKEKIQMERAKEKSEKERNARYKTRPRRCSLPKMMAILTKARTKDPKRKR